MAEMDTATRAALVGGSIGLGSAAAGGFVAVILAGRTSSMTVPFLGWAATSLLLATILLVAWSWEKERG